MTADILYKDVLHALVNKFWSYFSFSIVLDKLLKSRFHAQKSKSVKGYKDY